MIKLTNQTWNDLHSIRWKISNEGFEYWLNNFCDKKDLAVIKKLSPEFASLCEELRESIGRLLDLADKFCDDVDKHYDTINTDK